MFNYLISLITLVTSLLHVTFIFFAPTDTQFINPIKLIFASIFGGISTKCGAFDFTTSNQTTISRDGIDLAFTFSLFLQIFMFACYSAILLNSASKIVEIYVKKRIRNKSDDEDPFLDIDSSNVVEENEEDRSKVENFKV